MDRTDLPCHHPPAQPSVRRSATAFVLAALLAVVAGCMTTSPPQRIDPSTIDTSTTDGLIQKLQAEFDSRSDGQHLRYIGFLIADYGTSMTSQAVGKLLEDDSLTLEQSIWLQEVRIDMGRGLVSCAANPIPASNIFQELFIMRIAYLIVKREAPSIMGEKAEPLVKALDGIQSLVWSKLTDAVKAPLTPFEKDVQKWMKQHEHDTSRFWWPREVGLLMSLDSMDEVKFSGMLASVERANAGIDQLDNELQNFQFVIERLPMLASWEIQLAFTKMLATPSLQSVLEGVGGLAGDLGRLNDTMDRSFDTLSTRLGGFEQSFTGRMESFVSTLKDLSGVLETSRQRLTGALTTLATSFESQAGVLAERIEQAAREISTSSDSISSTLERLDQTLLRQETKLESLAEDLPKGLSGELGGVVDGVSLRLGFAVGLGVLAALLVSGVLALLAIRLGLLAPGR